MPLIIDNNRKSDLTGTPTEVARVVLRAIMERRTVKVAVCEDVLRELKGDRKMQNLLDQWRRIGQLKRADEAVYAAELARLGSKLRKSDDRHVLALALATTTRLLYSDDQDLIDDFGDPILIKFEGKPSRGKAFQSSTKLRIVRRLLRIYGK